MDLLNIVLAVVVGGVILFLWTGFTQNVLPWGIRSVNQSEQEEAGRAIANVLPDGMLYLKNQVAAFIAIKPESYYSMGRYFAIEFATQLIASAVLVGILILTADLDSAARLLIVGLTGLAGIASIDLQYWNWWGFSTRYTVGVAVNRLVGYLLMAFVLVTWVLQ